MISAYIFVSSVLSQQPPEVTPEQQPQFNYQSCDANSCTTAQSSVVLDANWRWLHQPNMGANCYDGSWNVSSQTEAQQCVLEGISTEGYEGTYGITTPGYDTLDMDYVTNHQYGTNVGARTYLMESPERYFMARFAGEGSYQEFSFDVDVSKLPCGTNGALYFSEMNPNGDLGVGGNNSGAEYGTGYCDAQCPKDIKFINGNVNYQEQWGACCMEMDIWEANSRAQAFTPHNCARRGNNPLIACDNDTDCGVGDQRFEGVCDKNGCDLNPYRFGIEDFYGPGPQFTVDTTKPMKVVTQFVQDPTTKDVTDIKRLYVQDGQVIHSPTITIDVNGAPYTFDGINDEMCRQTKDWMQESDSSGNRVNHWETLGGMAQMSKAFRDGMVLVMSIWDDTSDARMQWLDSHYPVDGTNPGDSRGTCAAASTNYFENTRLMYGPTSDAGQANGVCEGTDINGNQLCGHQYEAKVAFSNVRFGYTLGSTFDGDSTTQAPNPSTQEPTPTQEPNPSTQEPNPAGVQQLFQRCDADFGSCQPELQCVTTGEIRQCRKPSKNMQHAQLYESCDLGAGCSPYGLQCNSADNHCEIDASYVPLPGPVPTTQAPTTQAPVPSTQAPTTQAPTTQAPTTQAPTTQAPVPSTQAPSNYKCLVCYWNCSSQSSWQDADGDASRTSWAHQSESNCSNVSNGGCYCYGLSPSDCLNSFSSITQSNGIRCTRGRLLSEIIV